MANILFRLLFLLGLLQVVGCSLLKAPPESVLPPPQARLRLLPAQEVPPLLDDCDHPSLIAAATRHLAYLRRQNREKPIFFDNQPISIGHLTYSLQRLVDKLQEMPSPEQLHHFLVDNYLVYQVAGRDDRPFGELLTTGYYEPIFAGSLVPTPVFTVPLYAPPSSLIALDPSDSGKGMARRDQRGQLVPFWSRAEIDGHPDLLKGNELVYLSDPFEAFLLHLQGSGRIRLPDQSLRSIGFAATNGHEYKSIGKLLVDQGKLTLEAATIPGIRNYLRHHPEETVDILHHNPRYVFFRWRDDAGPRGSSGEILTPGRSVALDKGVLPIGPFAFLKTRLPSGDDQVSFPAGQALARIVFPQDTGAAISGAGRIDIFLGSGSEAEEIAHRLKEPGQLYFFLWKNRGQW